jgi:hypothetical protein
MWYVRFMVHTAWRRKSLACNMEQAMDQFERNRLFREDAEAKGLIVFYNDYKKPRHFFDINAGSYFSADDASPAKLKELVELARKHADDDGYGDHHALLNLVANREELAAWEKGIGEKTTLLWHRSYYVIPIKTKDREREEKKWISLREYLAERGQEPNIKFDQEDT